MNFLFLGLGPIASRFLESYVAPALGNNALVVSRNSKGIVTDGSILVNKPVSESIKDIDVVINSWKSLDYLDRGWEIDYLNSLASSDNSKMLFFNLSSVAVYGECKEPADEDAILNPINEYGIKKLEFENFLKGIGVPNLLNLRISNVFGDERFGDFINLLINSPRRAAELCIDDPDEIFRDFIDISRVNSTLFDLIFRRGNYLASSGMDLNICSGNSLSLMNIIEIYNSVSRTPLTYRVSAVGSQIIRESRVSNTRLKSLIASPSWDSVEEISNYFRGRMGI